MEEAVTRFRAGDLVRLKSGGPQLLVTGHNDFTVMVMWFTADGELRDAEIEHRWLVGAL